MWAWAQQLQRQKSLMWIMGATLAVTLLVTPLRAHALIPLTVQNPKSNSFGLEATKTQPAPTTGATISTPGSGSSFNTSPITVSGLCTGDLLVQVYDNGVLAGSVTCANGSFQLQISLFTGQNDITATVFDDLDQAGPPSNTVTVTYNNSSITAFGTLVTLTSTYARRAANPGSTLTWPLLLSGGNGPYAFSIDWGDGTPSELKSQPNSGTIDLSHVYAKAGLYKVVVKVTDVNGVSAFLQLVAIANGTPVTASGSAKDSSSGSTTIIRIIWWPALICAVLLIPTYWLGRRSELVSLHKKLEKDMAAYKEL